MELGRVPARPGTDDRDDDLRADVAAELVRTLCAAWSLRYGAFDLLVTAAGSGTCLAVITAPGADLGLVAYEMAVMVKRSSEHIRVNVRTAALPGWA